MKPFVLNLVKQYESFIAGMLAMSGGILISTFIATPAELENQFFLGLSFRRLVIGVAFLLFLGMNIVVFLFSIRKLNILKEFLELHTDTWVPWAIAFLYVGAFVFTVLWFGTLSPPLDFFRFLRAYRDQLDNLFLWVIFLCVYLITYLKLKYLDTIRSKGIIRYSENLIIGGTLLLTVFFLYAYFAIQIGWVNKEKYVFWDILAEQFLQGRLYIPNPPYTHDLTLHNGNWYVPMPPLPGVLIMPLISFIGVENFNASYFSIFFSALNGVLVYWILLDLSIRKWINLSYFGVFILVALFLFGTPHLWVGISGRGWYISQILTVFFLALATYAALRSWSPWMVGVCIGLAMTARPNSLMTWPFIFSIAMQLFRDRQGQVSWRDALSWSMKTAFPIVLVVAGLFFYNYLRFGDFLDFGYMNINGDPGIVKNIRTWGMFHPHFIPRNLQVMFIELPWISLDSRWPIEPSAAGMSIFLTTPALIYLFHRYPKDWWVTGAWIAILFNISILSMYHNTGAHQFGYRYILDLQLPLFAMIAVGMKKKIPWHFVILVLLSIVVNLYGADWFMNA